MEGLAPELISRIALFSICDDGFSPGPPFAFLPLTLTCHTINRSLSLNQNLALLADVFRLKFDASAVSRRFSSCDLNASHFSQELKRRCRALQRIKADCVDESTLHEDLWIAYFMMLENDGYNEEQLLWANLSGFLRKLLTIFAKPESSLQKPKKSILLVVGLVWLTSTYDKLQTESLDERELLFSVLQPLVVLGCWHPSFYVSETFFDAGSPHSSISAHARDGETHSKSRVVHYGQLIDVCTPPATSEAFLAITARLDYNRRITNNHIACLLSLPPNREAADAMRFSGPTLEDMVEARSASVRPWSGSSSRLRSSNEFALKMTSAQHDSAWLRLTLMNSNRPSESPPLYGTTGSAFAPGQLAGLWTGKLLVPDVGGYRACLAGSSVVEPHDVPLYQRPLYMRLREHHCSFTEKPIWSGIDPDEQDIFKTWLPERYTFVEHKEKKCLHILDRVSHAETTYATYVPDPPGSAHTYKCSREHSIRTSEVAAEIYGLEADEETRLKMGVRDILLTGETDPRHGEAWGHYKFIGRVRPLDGLILLRREPRNSEQIELGTWIFLGYIQAPGVLVGRWRESSIKSALPVLEGPFVASKQ